MTGPDGGALLRVSQFAEPIAVRGDLPGPNATVAVRPEDIEISLPGARRHGTDANVLDASYLGDHYQYLVAVGPLRLTVHSQQQLARGPVRVHIPAGVATFVDDHQENSLV